MKRSRSARSAVSHRVMSWRVSASSIASVVSRQVWGLQSVLLDGAALGEAVRVGTCFDDVAAEGQAVDDGGAEAGSVKVLVQPLKDSLEAMATLAFSSRSVRTWKRSSAPRRSSSM
jgi:hypothetical protein